MQIAITLLIVLHGLIHLIGFVKAFGLATISRLTQPITQPMGLVWLGACLLFIYGGISCFIKNPLCWVAIGTGIMISQTLIGIYWQDTKAGTFINILLLPVLLTNFGVWNFQKKVGQTVEILLNSSPLQKSDHSPSARSLPSLVQFWLHQTGASEKPLPQHVIIKQAGEMKTSPDGTWNRFSATHWTSFDKPGFVWHATMNAGYGLHIAVLDQLVEGKGTMVAKIQSLITLNEATGQEMDEGTMQRYLAEMVWTPSFALSPYVQWEQIDNVRAKATLKYEEKEASVIFTFNAAGMIKQCEAERFYYQKEESRKVPWVVDMDESSYQRFDGIVIPAKSTITWKMENGDYTWFKLEIKESNISF